MNIILKDGRKELYQWDTGRQIQFDDSAVEQAHFSNKLFGRSMDVDIVDGVCTIPDELLQTGRPLHVYAWVGTALDGYTKAEKVFPVIPRNKPSDYVFTPTDQKTLEDLQNQIGDLSNLKTKDKDNLVGAINEAAASSGGDDLSDDTLLQCLIDTDTLPAVTSTGAILCAKDKIILM